MENARKVSPVALDAVQTKKVGTPITLEATHVNALLDRLATDDVFRELYKRDTRAALRAVGVPEAAAMCIATKNLASKETFVAARDALFAQLSSTLMYTPFLLEVR